MGQNMKVYFNLVKKQVLENIYGEMDKYLGKIMTVKRVDLDAVRMFEDGGMWSWYPAAIDEIVDECDIEPATQEELLALLMG